MRKSLDDLLAGLIFIGIGLGFGYASLGYDLGTARRMGPGYFPLVLAGVLVLLGVVIAGQGLLKRRGHDLGRIPWRGAALLLPALLFFGLAVRDLGLVPALFGATFLSSLASYRNGPLMALALAVGLTAFCVLIFIYGLGVPLPLFGPLLRF